MELSTSVPMHRERLTELLGALDAYRPARESFLEVLGIPVSNRDPLAELSEQLVRAIWGGTLAKSRVQKGYNVVLPDERKVQVRYVANTSDRWINEHVVRGIADVELYGLVIFERFSVAGAVLFSLGRIAEVHQLLVKRHPNQTEQLQFTARNWQSIRDNPIQFAQAGVSVWIKTSAQVTTGASSDATGGQAAAQPETPGPES